MKVWIIMMHREQQDRIAAEEGRVHSVHSSYDNMITRIEAIAKRNKQYEMTTVEPFNNPEGSPMMWRIGPREDQGFFGNSPLTFWAVEMEMPFNQEDQT